MSDDRPSALAQLFEAERRFHELMPIEDSHSKLFFRSVFWFAVFSVTYLIVSSL